MAKKKEVPETDCGLDVPKFRRCDLDLHSAQILIIYIPVKAPLRCFKHQGSNTDYWSFNTAPNRGRWNR